LSTSFHANGKLDIFDLVMTGVGNLRPVLTLDMACIRIFVTQFRVQNRVKTKIHNKQVL